MRDEWQKIAKKAAAHLPKSHCLVFFQKTAILSFEKGVLHIGLPREFYRPWMEKNAKNALLIATRELFPDCVSLNFIVDGTLETTSDFDPRTLFDDHPLRSSPVASSAPPKKKEVSFPRPLQAGFSHRFLHPDLTFQNFVVGGGVALAHAAAKTAAEHPGKKYSPLFIFGGVGLGKTHLLHAMGNHIAGKFSDADVIVLSAQKFADEVVSAVRSGKAEEVRSKFGRGDVFMLDDVQFLVGKERTQEILFHIFNDLHQQGKQIVFSSDRSPSTLDGLEERLVSRFSMGMIVDIQPPDFETRMAILEQKNESSGRHFSTEVLEIVAEHSPSSIRELLAIFSQMVAHFELQGVNINMTNIFDILKRRNREIRYEQAHEEEKKSGKAMTIQEIAERVSQHFEISVEQMKSSSRLKEINAPRQIAMFFAHRRLGEPLQKIGAFFGGRDHTSVLSAVRRVEQKKKLSTAFWREVNILRKALGL